MERIWNSMEILGIEIFDFFIADQRNSFIINDEGEDDDCGPIFYIIYHESRCIITLYVSFVCCMSCIFTKKEF